MNFSYETFRLLSGVSRLLAESKPLRRGLAVLGSCVFLLCANAYAENCVISDNVLVYGDKVTFIGSETSAVKSLR